MSKKRPLRIYRNKVRQKATMVACWTKAQKTTLGRIPQTHYRLRYKGGRAIEVSGEQLRRLWTWIRPVAVERQRCISAG